MKGPYEVSDILCIRQINILFGIYLELAKE